MGDGEDKNSSGVAIIAVFCLDIFKMYATCNLCRQEDVEVVWPGGERLGLVMRRDWTMGRGKSGSDVVWKRLMHSPMRVRDSSC